MATRPRLRPVPPHEDRLVVVLRNPSQVIDPELATDAAAAARQAVFMIAR